MVKVTLPKLKSKKGNEKIAMVTCYDATFARLVERLESIRFWSATASAW